jgi:DNA-binding NarL/FixJ family response regulator
MRNLITTILIKIFGGTEMMAMLFACRVIEERTTFEQVPRLLKQQVADIIINDFGMPELVPAEYGGTAE